MQILVGHRYLLVIVYPAPKKYSYIAIYDSLHESAHLNFCGLVILQGCRQGVCGGGGGGGVKRVNNVE